MKQLVPIEDVPIFKSCLLEYTEAITVKEERIENDVIEFELMIESLNELYYLGQFVGTEKSKEFFIREQEKIMKKMQLEDGLAKITYLLTTKEEAEIIKDNVCEFNVSGKMYEQSAPIENKNLKKEYVISAIEFESRAGIYNLGKIVNSKIKTN